MYRHTFFHLLTLFVTLTLSGIVIAPADGATGSTLTNIFSLDTRLTPTIQQITPNSGAIQGGTSVVILGTNFVSGRTTVKFGGKNASKVVVQSSTLLTAVTPAGSAGRVDVQVINPGGTLATLENGFKYQAPEASKVTVAASPTSIVANGQMTSQISVTVESSDGFRITDETVTLLADKGRIDQTAQHQGNGVYTATYTAPILASQEATTAEITALTDNGVSETTKITLTPRKISASKSAISAPSQAPLPIADGVEAVEITVTVRDEQGLPMSAKQVVLDAPKGVLVTKPPLTNAQGRTKAQVKTTVAGSHTIRASVDGVALADTVRVEFTHGAATRLEITASPDSLPADGDATSEVTVRVFDANDNPVKNAEMTLTVLPIGNGKATKPQSQGDGRYTAVYTAGNTIGEITLVVALTTAELSGTRTLTLTPRQVDATRSTVESPSAPTVADNQSLATLTVKVLDTRGLPLPQAKVESTSDRAEDSIEAISPTDSQGVSTISIRSTKAGEATVTVTANGVELQSKGTVVFKAGATTRLELTADRMRIPADGKSTSTITAKAFDKYDNPVADAQIRWECTVGSIVPLDESSGTYTAIYTPPLTFGTVEITATVGNVTKSLTLTLTDRQPSASFSEVDVENASATVDDEINPPRVTVTLQDDDGTPIGGKHVRVDLLNAETQEIEGQFEALSPTNEAGVVVIELFSHIAGRKKLIVHDLTDDITLDTQKIVVFLPGAPHRVKVRAGSRNLEADGVSISPIEIIVTDRYDNPIDNATVELSVDRGSIQDALPRGQRGEYEALYTAGNTPGTASITAKVDGQAGRTQIELVQKDTVAEIDAVEVAIYRGSSTFPLDPRTQGRMAGRAGDVVRVTVEGEAESTVTFSIDGILGKQSMDLVYYRTYSGSYTIEDGDNVTDALVTITLTDAKGNVATDEKYRITIDTELPPAPSNLRLVNDKITLDNVTQVEITGSASPFAEVNIVLTDERGASVEGTTSATATGQFTLSVDATELADGQVSIVAFEAPDIAGNEGIKSTPLAVEKDTTPDVAPSFKLNADSESLRGASGKTVVFSVEVLGIRGFNSSVTLSADNLPIGISAAFSPKTVTLTPDEPLQKAEITLTIAPGVSLETHRFTVLGRSAGKTQEISLAIEVTKELQTATISVIPDSPTIRFGESLSVSGSLRFSAATPAKPPHAGAGGGLEIRLTYTPPTGQPQTRIATTNAAGNYTDTLSPIEIRGDWQITATFEAAGYQPTFDSATVEVIKGKSQIRWIDIPATIKLREHLLLSGQLTPHLPDEAITVRIQKPEQPAASVGESILTDGFGGFIHEQTFDMPGEWKFEAIWAGNENYENVRESITIQVVKDVGKAIIVHGGGNEDDYAQANWENFHKNAEWVYNTLTRKRYFTPDDVRYLSPTKEPDYSRVYETTSKPALQRAIDWAKGEVNEYIPLYIYLISHGESDDFLLEGPNSTNPYLTASEFNDLLNEIPPNVPITVIIEACYSGNFIKKLAGKNRVIITSANDREKAQVTRSTSFTIFFFDLVSRNKTVEIAFKETQNLLGGYKRRHDKQKPWLDANGNGIANELSDFLAVANVYIPFDITSAGGSALALSEPRAYPKRLEEGVSTAKISVQVTGNVTAVYATVIPPTSSTSAPDEFDLVDPDGDGVYEGSYDKFNQTGTYTIMISAEDAYGNITLPIQVNLPVGIESSPWDVNGDGIVDIRDLLFIGSNFGKTGANLAGDVNGDGVVDISDLVLVGVHW